MPDDDLPAFDGGAAAAADLAGRAPLADFTGCLATDAGADLAGRDFAATGFVAADFVDAGFAAVDFVDVSFAPAGLVNAGFADRTGAVATNFFTLLGAATLSAGFFNAFLATGAPRSFRQGINTATRTTFGRVALAIES